MTNKPNTDPARREDTKKQILKPYLIANEEYGGYDICSLDAEQAMQMYADQQTAPLHAKIAELEAEISDLNARIPKANPVKQ